jgi:hypothetical protein
MHRGEGGFARWLFASSQQSREGGKHLDAVFRHRAIHSRSGREMVEGPEEDAWSSLGAAVGGIVIGTRAHHGERWRTWDLAFPETGHCVQLF